LEGADVDAAFGVAEAGVTEELIDTASGLIKPARLAIFAALDLSQR
jgi:hypothetical protein